MSLQFGNSNLDLFPKFLFLNKLPVVFGNNDNFLLFSHLGDFSYKFHRSIQDTESIPLRVFKSILGVYQKYIKRVYYKYTMKKISQIKSNRMAAFLQKLPELRRQLEAQK